MKIQGYIFLLFCLLSNVLWAQNPNEDKNGNLEIKGEIVVSESNFKVCACIAKSDALDGVKAFTKNERTAEISAFAMGDWSSSYLVNDNSTPAGNIFYRFEFVVKEGKVSYRFYHFKHEQKDSEFASFGQLPSEWNDTVGKAFNKGQYWEIINAIQTNIAKKIQVLSSQCLQK